MSARTPEMSSVVTKEEPEPEPTIEEPAQPEEVSPGEEEKEKATDELELGDEDSDFSWDDLDTE